MDNSIRSDIGVKNKEMFEAMIKSAGYENINRFCKDIGLDTTNLYSNLNGTWKMSLKRMFRVANVLRVPVDKIVEIFYPEEYQENLEKVEQANQEEIDALFSSEM